MPTRDKGNRLELDNKTLALTNGSIVRERAPRLTEHWVSDLVAGVWTATETGAATPWAAAATANDGGIAVATSGATTNNAEELGGKHIVWKPSLSVNQNLVFETRFKSVGATTAADGDYTIGLADAATYASGLAYVFSAASAFTTSAPSEFVGFHYSSIPTSGALFNSGGNNFIGAVSSKANVDTVASTAIAKDSAFHIYRIEVNSAGNVALFIDDNLVYTLGAAITAATALTPYMAVIAKNSHANTGSCNYVSLGGDFA